MLEAEHAANLRRLHKAAEIIHGLFAAPKDSPLWREAAAFEREIRVVENQGKDHVPLIGPGRIPQT